MADDIEIWFERGVTDGVIGPEHAKTIGAAGWSKRDVKQYLFETIRRPARQRAPGPDGAAIVPGWMGGEMGSRPVTRAIDEGERRA